MNKNQIRLAMVGCGMISHAHAIAARKSSYDIVFSACTSRRIESAQSWAKEYDCANAYDNLHQMLLADELDGVVIATWPRLHCEQILACVEAGVRMILCEKALVTDSREAALVRRAADQAGATLVEGFMYRHHPAILRLEELSSAQTGGPPDSIHAVFNMLDEGAGHGNWRRRPDAGGGVPYDFLCYPVDAACHFAGSLPRLVFATGSQSPAGVIDRVFATIWFDNDVVATVESSRRSSLQQRLEIRYANSTLSLPFAWSPGSAVQIELMSTSGFLTHQKRTETIAAGCAHDGRLVDFPVFTLQMDNFAECILGTAQPRVTLSASLINACVIEAMLRSVGSGRQEKVWADARKMRQVLG